LEHAVPACAACQDPRSGESDAGHPLDAAGRNGLRGRTRDVRALQPPRRRGPCDAQRDRARQPQLRARRSRRHHLYQQQGGGIRTALRLSTGRGDRGERGRLGRSRCRRAARRIRAGRAVRLPTRDPDLPRFQHPDRLVLPDPVATGAGARILDDTAHRDSGVAHSPTLLIAGPVPPGASRPTGAPNAIGLPVFSVNACGTTALRPTCERIPLRRTRSMSTGKRKRGGAFARAGLRPAPKGRAIDAAALATVQALLGDRPRRPDLLIEYLHLLQDHNGHLPVAQLNALAFELRLTPAEVYEVATFYHHFDVVTEGDVAPPPITVRVCDSISCHLAGSDELLDSLRDARGPGIRVIPAPCVGRCDGAPVAVVGRNPIERAGTASITDAVRRHQVEPVIPEYPDYAAYRANGGYALLAECVSGARSAEDVIAQVEASGLRGLGGAG